MSASGQLIAALAGALVLAAPPASALAPERLMLVVDARGAHHWVCSVEEGRFHWRLESLDVEILEPDGRLATRLGSANAWRMADGTRLRGHVAHASDVPRRHDLIWLELHAVGDRDRASRVAQAMRFAQSADGPGARPCAPERLGARVQVSWTGEYYFFAPA